MRKLNEGDIVEIIGGPYKGTIGKIDEIIEFDPGVVGYYIIKTKEVLLIKIIDSALLRPIEENEPEPEEEKEETITISRSELRETVIKTCTSKELLDSFKDPTLSLMVSMSGMVIGRVLEKELFND